MSRPDFERAAKLATALLCIQENLSYPILEVEEMDFGSRTIFFDTLQHYAQLAGIHKMPRTGEGCTIHDRDNDIHIILYDEKKGNYTRHNWTMAHEVGHIFLGHEFDSEKSEVEAHFFASQLFMPELTIRKMQEVYGPTSPELISLLFGVSMTAARKRLDTLQRLRTYSMTEADKTVCRMQWRRIAEYYYCKEHGYRYYPDTDWDIGIVVPV